MPSQLVSNIKDEFLVPQVAMKVWDMDAQPQFEAYASDVSDDVKVFASSLVVPYIGLNAKFEASTWLDNPDQALSVALIPLRDEGIKHAFGMLILASPDAQRFNASMGTEFLERIGDIASAALSRLRSELGKN